jgi:hypothetical protein
MSKSNIWGTQKVDNSFLLLSKNNSNFKIAKFSSSIIEWWPYVRFPAQLKKIYSNLIKWPIMRRRRRRIRVQTLLTNKHFVNIQIIIKKLKVYRHIFKLRARDPISFNLNFSLRKKKCAVPLKYLTVLMLINWFR